MLKRGFYSIVLIFWATACSVIHQAQTASHPLVNEVKGKPVKSKPNRQVASSPSVKPVQYASVKPSHQTVVQPEKKEEKVSVKTYSEKKEKSRPEAEEAIVHNIVKEAEKYLGTPYKTGGTSLAGIDCSGLAMKVYQTQGIQLPRISVDQYRFGRPLKIEEVQAGDLLFFSTPSKPNEIGHTAICVGKENEKIKFIHAASTGVRYDYLVPGYYMKHYKGACRVLTPHLSEK